ncbi:unnamed protein product, partial [Allacma fusca]
ILRGAHA